MAINLDKNVVAVNIVGTRTSIETSSFIGNPSNGTSARGGGNITDGNMTTSNQGHQKYQQGYQAGCGDKRIGVRFTEFNFTSSFSEGYNAGHDACKFRPDLGFHNYKTSNDDGRHNHHHHNNANKPLGQAELDGYHCTKEDGCGYYQDGVRVR